MTDTGGTERSRTAHCSVCSSIPPYLLVNTGRDGRFPLEVGRLTRLGLASDRDLYECPDCGALFEWQDLPQFYGSGNCAEERVRRLDDAATAAARALLAPEPSARDNEGVRARGTRGNMSFELMCKLLGRLAVRDKATFSAVWLAPTVRSYVAGSDHALVLWAVIDSYCGDDSHRASEVIALIDEAHSAGETGGKYLRQQLSARVAKAAPEAASKQSRVDLYNSLYEEKLRIEKAQADRSEEPDPYEGQGPYPIDGFY
jgi:hypothetical protein